MINPDLLKSSSKFFDAIDTNKDGQLTKDEIKKALSNSGIPVSQKLLDTIFSDCDKDSNGVITKQEFSEFYGRQTSRLKFIFDEVDKDKNGHLSIDEFRSALKDFDASITDKEITLLINRMDTDHSNTITFDEFMFYYHLIPINNIKLNKR